jgi:hypothetical protein
MDPVVMDVVLLVAAVVLVACWAALVTARVRRLDRLHRRMDAARAGLDGALRRRAEAAQAAGLPVPDRSDGLGRDREAAENALGRRLAALDRALLPEDVLGELVEAEQRMAIARRVHNDAVRDTLVLRSSRLVRVLHLAGTAPMPAYFEIADPASAVGPPRMARPPHVRSVPPNS